MTSPNGSGGEPPVDLGVYDLRPSPKAGVLPLAVGQIILVVGAAMMLFGLWALASTAITDGTSRAAQSGSGGGSGDNSTEDSDLEAHFDCNEDRTVCRFTSPEGFETYVCIEPCILPDWVPDDAYLVRLAQGGTGIDGTDFGSDGRGALLPLASGHNRSDYIQFAQHPNGGISLRVIGEGGTIPIRQGALAPSAEPQSAEPSSSGESSTSDGGGSSTSGGRWFAPRPDCTAHHPDRNRTRHLRDRRNRAGAVAARTIRPQTR